MVVRSKIAAFSRSENLVGGLLYARANKKRVLAHSKLDISLSGWGGICSFGSFRRLTRHKFVEIQVICMALFKGAVFLRVLFFEVKNEIVDWK